MFAQEPPPDFDVPGRREPGERPELVTEVGLVEVACLPIVAGWNYTVRLYRPRATLLNGTWKLADAQPVSAR